MSAGRKQPNYIALSLKASLQSEKIAHRLKLN